MAVHTSVFISNIDAAGVFANLAPAADARVFTTGNNLRVPALTRLVAAAGGADAVVTPRIRLTSPTLDEMTRYEISPLNSQNAAGVEPDSPQKVDDMRLAPLTLGLDELLACELNNNSAAVQDQWAVLWFADDTPQPPGQGRVFTVRGTGTTTLVDITWTLVDITLDDNLPPGNYQAVGLRPESLGCVAARFVFRTGDFFRPGALGTDNILDIQHPMFRHGGLGVLGNFPFTQLPAMEFMSVIADTVQTTYWDLMRTGS